MRIRHLLDYSTAYSTRQSSNLLDYSTTRPPAPYI